MFLFIPTSNYQAAATEARDAMAVIERQRSAAAEEEEGRIAVGQAALAAAEERAARAEERAATAEVYIYTYTYMA